MSDASEKQPWQYVPGGDLWQRVDPEAACNAYSIPDDLAATNSLHDGLRTGSIEAYVNNDGDVLMGKTADIRRDVGHRNAAKRFEDNARAEREASERREREDSERARIEALLAEYNIGHAKTNDFDVTVTVTEDFTKWDWAWCGDQDACVNAAYDVAVEIRNTAMGWFKVREGSVVVEYSLLDDGIRIEQSLQRVFDITDEWLDDGFDEENDRQTALATAVELEAIASKVREALANHPTNHGDKD